jgi:hypothetical protein
VYAVRPVCPAAALGPGCRVCCCLSEPLSIFDKSVGCMVAICSPCGQRSGTSREVSLGSNSEELRVSISCPNHPQQRTWRRAVGQRERSVSIGRIVGCSKYVHCISCLGLAKYVRKPLLYPAELRDRLGFLVASRTPRQSASRTSAIGEIRTRYTHVALFAFYAQPAPRGSALGNAVNPMRSAGDLVFLRHLRHPR